MTNNGFPANRIRLFENDWLERLTLITPQAFAFVWLIFLGVAFYAGWRVVGPGAWAALFAAGVIGWTLFEYVMHRFIFHLELKSKFGQWLIHLAHGNHHVVPDDRERNIMPPVVSVVICCMVWAALWSLIGDPGTVIFLGFAVGYVIYDIVHYACHQLPMRSPLLRQLRRHHIRHHYARQDGNYAITAIFWDRVFGTEVPTKRR